MEDQKETSRDRFQRLLPKRLGKTLEEIRLLSQLSSHNYSNTPEEALDLVRNLDASVHTVAKAFGVNYRSAYSAPGLRAPQPIHATPINVIDVARAIDLIGKGQTKEAVAALQSALSQEPRL